MIERHVQHTGSAPGQQILNNWNESITKFVKVIPKDYKKMLEQISKAKDKGFEGEAALLEAFEANKRELARV
ncbi:Ferredoxin-dependent glutamate synthase 1 [compost metagenome]